MEVITNDEVRRAIETQLDRLETYHYLMWENENWRNDYDGYERVY